MPPRRAEPASRSYRLSVSPSSATGGLENPRPFRFGLVFTGEADGPRLRDLARRLEGEGFSSLLVADHYGNPMACGVVQMAVAAATTTLRVGRYVYDNDFRHPALLAKEAATIDVLSGGRLELGIGAGWSKDEYDAVGLPFDPGPTRVSRLEESIDILTALWAGGPVTFRGTYYQIDGLPGMPLPIQRPLPLPIGGGGPRMLRLAARRASIVGLVPRSLPDGGLDPDEFGEGPFDARIAAVDLAVEEAGRSADPPERSLLVFHTSRSRAEVGDGGWVRSDLVERSPYVLLGDTGKMVETLQARRARWGVSYIVCYERDLERMLPVAKSLSGS